MREITYRQALNEALAEELERDPNVFLMGEEVAAEINGDEDACCALLASLVSRGHRIVEFKQQRANLEEIFMSVTKGAVQ